MVEDASAGRQLVDIFAAGEDGKQSRGDSQQTSMIGLDDIEVAIYLSSSVSTLVGGVMPWRVVSATALGSFRLIVQFVDGLSGTVDVPNLVHSARAGVSARLADQKIFAQLFVDNGAVAWPGELDLAPDAMYREIQRCGECRI